MPHNLSYPLDVEGDDQQGHYIMFMINESTPGKVKPGTSPSATNSGMGFNSVPPEQHLDTLAEQAQNTNLHHNQGAGQTNQEVWRSQPKGTGLWMSRPSTTRMAQAITLYMPPSVKVGYKSNYKDDEISARASGIGDVAGKLGAAMAGGAIDWEGLATSAGEGVGVIAAFAAKAAADTFAPGASTLAQLSAGSILGSKLELMFTDVGRRSFSFQFNFIPKSEPESRRVYDIVQTFKEHMLPEYLTSFTVGGRNIPLGQGRVLKIPDTFDISYFFHDNENPFLNKISTCYLSSLDIDYGGDKYVTYEPTVLNDRPGSGPPPQRTSITLAFTEIEIITRERAAQGF